MVGFIHGLVATVLTLICIGVYVRFGQVRGIGVARIVRRNVARAVFCGNRCGWTAMIVARIHWSFNYEIEEFEF